LLRLKETMPKSDQPPQLWSDELPKLNPVPPAPLVIIASLLIGAVLFLVGGLVANNRLPKNPERPVIDQGLDGE